MTNYRVGVVPPLRGEVRAVRVDERCFDAGMLRVFGWLRHETARIVSAWLHVDDNPSMEVEIDEFEECGCIIRQELRCRQSIAGREVALSVCLDNGESIVVELAPLDAVFAPGGRPRYELPVKFQELPAWSPPAPCEVRDKMTVCIVTTDFVGPIKNGGMGTCYTNMAQLLAAHGHEVTVLYDQGAFSEHGTIESWIEHYAAQGIQFVPMPQLTNLTTASWIRKRSYAAYQWLKERDFDWIHFHEMVGAGFYTCLAAKLGIAFQRSTICIGLHSPTRWHMHYNHALPSSISHLEVDHMERVTIECADILTSPSQYLLDWCWKDGWALPSNHAVFLYPLVGVESPVASEERREISEIVFFGRLESRKGLRLFCDAIDRLLAEDVRPNSITFLGKDRGEGGVPVSAYIARRSQTWGIEPQILSLLGRDEAVAYLRNPGRLAVIASLSDNSPYTVYECLSFGIAFLASNVGGIPELVARENHKQVLFELHAQSLAEKLKGVLSHGALTPRAVSSPHELNQRWLTFHHHPIVTRQQPRVRVTRGAKPLAVLLLPTSRGEERQRELDDMLEAAHACGDRLEVLIPELRPDTEEYDIEKVRTLLRGTCARYVLPCQRTVYFNQESLARFIDILEGVDADVVCPITAIGDPRSGDVSERVLELPLGSAASVELYLQSTAVGHLVALKCDSLLAQDTLEISDISRNSRIVAKALVKHRSIIPVPEVLGVIHPRPEQDYAQDEFEASLERLESFEYRQLPSWQRDLLQYSLGLFHRLGSDLLRDPSPSEASSRLPELFMASSEVTLRADPMVGFDSLQEHSGVIEPRVGRAYSFRCTVEPAQFLMYHSMLSGSKTVIVKLSVYAQYTAMISLRYLKNSESAFAAHGESRIRVAPGQSTVYMRLDLRKCQGFVTLSILMPPGVFEISECELRRCFIPGFGRAALPARQRGTQVATRARQATVRFVILFEGRTGSTHLTQWLDSLQYVRCLPESLEQLSSQGQLWWIRRLFLEAQPSLEAVGFKTKLRDVKDAEEFRRSIHEFGCRVLYMTRRNVIKAVLSTMNAERRFAATGEWNQLPGMPALGPLEVSPQHMDGYLRFRLEKEAVLARFIESLESPIMRLDYDELLANEAAVLRSVCEFLGISSREGASRVLKQTDDDLAKALLNYEELRNYYRATPYEEMF